KHALVMRRHWHSSPTFTMRIGTWPFCATYISGITRARWSIIKHTAGSFPTTARSSNGLPIFANARAERRNHAGKLAPHVAGRVAARVTAGDKCRTDG